jgi:hypothetical protein
VRTTEELLERKGSGSSLEKPRLTTAVIRCADHATPSVRKSRHYFVNKRRSLGQYSSLADHSHGILVWFSLIVSILVGNFCYSHVLCVFDLGNGSIWTEAPTAVQFIITPPRNIWLPCISQILGHRLWRSLPSAGTVVQWVKSVLQKHFGFEIAILEMQKLLPASQKCYISEQYFVSVAVDRIS